GKQRRTRKDQAGVHGGHRPLLHHEQEQEDHAREDLDHEVRSQGAQARRVQRDQAEV
ncbi:MAG: LSU ribosomal protein L33p @ LSU ribosomal protein L33p, zinc-independent, partial [uncultured Ramlibacter sp.]